MVVGVGQGQGEEEGEGEGKLSQPTRPHANYFTLKCVKGEL